MRILAAIDGSENSDAVVDEITQRHFPAETKVCVISVVEPVYPTMISSGVGVDTQLGDVQVYDLMQNASRERAHATVEKAAARLQASEWNRQLSVTVKVLFGAPKAIILEEADAFGADLIIVGSHGYGMIERFLLGSVSQAVALHAKCSVEIVRVPKSQTVAALFTNS